MYSTLAIAGALLGQAGEAPNLDCRQWISIFEKGYEFAHVYEPCLEEAKDGDPQVQYFVGVSYLFSGNEPLALDWLKKSAKRGFAPSHYALSEIYRDNGETDRAKFHLEKCKSLGSPAQCGG